MLEGTPVRPDDLDDDAFVLVAAVLPRAQTVGDAVTPEGLRGLGLPEPYPVTEDGERVDSELCQSVGATLRDRRFRGVWCRSAASADGRGRELAWFPATRRSHARPVWVEPLPLGGWREADGWADLGLPEQPDPHSRKTPEGGKSTAP